MPEMDTALDSIEAEILPTIASMLGALLDMACTAQPGVNAAHYAHQLHRLADQTDIVARQIMASTLPTQLPSARAARG